MSNRDRYKQNRDYHRYDRRGSIGSSAGRVYTAKDYILPVAMLVLGVVVLTATIICAQAGIFGRKSSRDSLPGVAPGLAASFLRTPEPDEDAGMLIDWKINRMVGEMTTEEKVGQLLLLRSHDIPQEEFLAEIAEVNAGGVVLFAKDVKNKTAEELIRYIGLLQEAAGGNMLVCVDEEGGTVVRVSSSRLLRDTPFSSPQRLYAEGGMGLIAYDATEKARFLRQFGINVNFAPVADVVTDPGAMMYDRAFGQDAAATSEYVTAVVTASEAAGVGTCIKHFPGYGNTAGDTHNGIVTLDTSLDQLRRSDLLPFAAGIEAGCGAVMITHTVMSAIDPDRPASMSPAVISLLRDELGFEGVIISDGMDMGAIKAYSDGTDVCVTAFLAGIDLMCTPTDSRATYSAFMAAVADGTISAEQLDEAVARILRWKLSLGLY